MAVRAEEVDAKRARKFLGAALAALLAFPILAHAQTVKLSSDDWLQVSPADPRAPIPRATLASAEPGTAVFIERRARFGASADSVQGLRAYAASKRDKHLHLTISLEERRLWVVVGSDTVMEAAVAVGSGATLVFGEQMWTFETPRGIRTIRGKDDDPDWIPPEWHYAETAREHGLRLVKLKLGKSHRISGGRKIMFKDGEAGVLHPDSGFFLLPIEEEIVFDNTLFVPPVGSKNRKVQGELGKYKLDTGAGVLLHGTPHKNTIGKAATHGCIRLTDEDIEWLYDYVPVGTKVYIY